MTISFFLKDGKAVAPTPIFARITSGSLSFKYYIGEKILPKYWNQRKQAARSTLAIYSDFNNLLQTRKEQIQTVISAHITKHKCSPSANVAKVLLDFEIKGKTTSDSDASIKTHLAAYFTRWIEQTAAGIRQGPKGKNIALATQKSYKTTLRTLQDFERMKKRAILFESVDLEFYKDFTEWLITFKRFSTGTIGKHIRVLKTVLNEAVSDDVTTNVKFRSKRFKAPNEEADTIYLNEEELSALQGLDLAGNARLERVRDLFLIGAYTGARFSDWGQLTPQNVGADNLISIKAEKTGKPIAIPIHHKVQRIFDRYEGHVPTPPSNQKVNDYLKELGQMVPILCRRVNKQITKGGLLISANVPKWQLLTTHTARRSFATNMYKDGYSGLTIMAITGHSTETSFLKYIRMEPTEHAQKLRDEWAANGISSPAKVG